MKQYHIMMVNATPYGKMNYQVTSAKVPGI